MKISLVFLLIEDILLLIGIGAFFYQRQRSYNIAGIILLIGTFLANVPSFLGYNSLFVVILPGVACTIIISLTRAFLPSPRVTINSHIIKVVLPFLFGFLLVLILLTIIGITLYLKK